MQLTWWLVQKFPLQEYSQNPQSPPQSSNDLPCCGQTNVQLMLSEEEGAAVKGRQDRDFGHMIRLRLFTITHGTVLYIVLTIAISHS